MTSFVNIVRKEYELFKNNNDIGWHVQNRQEKHLELYKPFKYKSAQAIYASVSV